MKKSFIIFSVWVLFVSCQKTSEDNINKVYLNLTKETYSIDGKNYKEISQEKTLVFEGVYIRYEGDKAASLIIIDAKKSAENGLPDIYLTGKKKGGGLKINTNSEDSLNLFISKVSLTSSDYPCIEITKKSPVFIYFSGQNTLTDGRLYEKDYSACDGAAKGTLFAKGNLNLVSMTKDSVLNISQGYRNCIYSDGDVLINDGNYNLTSTAKHGILAGTAFIMMNGNLNIEGKGSYENDESKGIVVKGNDSALQAYEGNGYIKIYSGKININTYGKAISAKWTSEDASAAEEKVTPDPSVYLYGGDYKIVTYGMKMDCASEGIEAKKDVNIYDGNYEINTVDDGINSSTPGNNVNIFGGNLYITSSKGDAIDSNGNILMEGGKLIAYALMGSENALDCGDLAGSQITINGGYLAAFGGSSRIEGDWSQSKQNYVNIEGVLKEDGPGRHGGWGRPGLSEGPDMENMPERPQGFPGEGRPDMENMPERPQGFPGEGGPDMENMPEPPDMPAFAHKQDSEHTLKCDAESISKISLSDQEGNLLMEVSLSGADSFGLASLSCPELNNQEAQSLVLEVSEK